MTNERQGTRKSVFYLIIFLLIFLLFLYMMILGGDLMDNIFEVEIRKMMKRNKISQRMLAEELGVHEETIRYRLRTMNKNKYKVMSDAIERMTKLEVTK